MFPDDELRTLKDRFSQMSDSELLQIVEVEYADYRQEALQLAKAELTKRNVSFERPEPIEKNGDEDDDESVYQAQSTEPCVNCGGSMRSGLLFADKELTAVFGDNNEERFVNLFACTKCGEVRLIVDLTTEVEG